MQPTGIRIQTIIRREPCAALVHGLAWETVRALQLSGNMQNESWQGIVLNCRALEGPLTFACQLDHVEDGI